MGAIPIKTALNELQCEYKRGYKRMNASAFKVYGNARGKMRGISHISIAVGQSPVCNTCKMGKICYGKRIYTHVRESYLGNGVSLTQRVFDKYDLPVVNTITCRFNAFGELFTGKKGVIQLTNYVNTAIKNRAQPLFCGRGTINWSNHTSRPMRNPQI